MKCLTVWILFGMLFFSACSCDGAIEFGLEKAVLELKNNEETEDKQIFTANSYGQWKWIELDLKNKFNLPDDDTTTHQFAVDLGLPKVLPNLELSFDYQWLSKYDIVDSGFEYTWKPFKGLKTRFDAETGNKSYKAGYDDRYRYNWNAQAINLGYNKLDWSYTFKLNRTEKEYAAARYYTREQYDLGQSLSKKLTSAWTLSLEYKETTRDYPYDTTWKRDYWGETWILQAKYKQKANKRWTWEGQIKNSEQNLEQYRNQYLTVGYDQWDRKHKLNWDLVVSKLECFDSAYADPDTTSDADEDTKSRTEQKLTLGYTYYFKIIDLGLELFAVDKDYLANSKDSRLTGLITNIIWECEKIKIKLKLAPFGSTASENAYYQLKLEYNPKDVVD